MDLREYQRDFCNSAWDDFQEFDRLLGVLPTGGGKTICFGKMAAYEPLQPALILAHREELINQAAAKIAKIVGHDVEIEKADQFASLDAPIVVGSIQSLANSKRLHRWPKDHFKFVVMDEAHHALSDTWVRVGAHFESAKILGVTATPHRGDKRSLGKFFQKISYEISLFELINQKYLCPIKIKTVPLRIAVDDPGRELSATEAATAIDPYLEECAEAILQHAAKRKTLIFLPLIHTSKRFMEMLRARGLNAEHVDGEDPDRARKLADFASGKISHLCNAMLLTEGYDEPSVDCVVCLRPTTSQALYAQMVGRGTRLHPGKEYLLLLDFLWMHERHKLVRPAHLVAHDDRIADAMIKMAEDTAMMPAAVAGTMPVIDLEAMHRAAINEREEKLRKELEKKAAKAERTVDVMEYALDIGEHDLADYEPTADWEAIAPSPRQLTLLKNFGISPASVKCAGQAREIIAKFLYRSKLKLATPRQLKHLKRMKHPSPHTATEKEASAWLDAKWGKKRS